MSKTLKNYSDNEILKQVKNVRSIAGLLKILNLIPAGGNYGTIKRRLKILNADTKHWTGQGWSLGHQLKHYEDYNRTSRLKIHIRSFKGNKCAKCNLAEWKFQPITLELNHIDGDRHNNKVSNLELLCPNCHSQTPDWRRRKRY